MPSRSIPLTPSVTHMRIQSRIPVLTMNLSAYWSLVLFHLSMSTIQSLLTMMSHYLQQLLVNQGDHERIARRRREKGKERSEGQHKFKGVRRAVRLGARRGHVLDRLLNKKVWTWLLHF